MSILVLRAVCSHVCHVRSGGCEHILNSEEYAPMLCSKGCEPRLGFEECVWLFGSERCVFMLVIRDVPVLCLRVVC